MKRRTFVRTTAIGALGSLGLQVVHVQEHARAQNESNAVEKPASDEARVATVAMHSQMGDPETNLDQVEHWAEKAHEAGARFAVFPEECITGSMNKSTLGKERAHQIAERSQKHSIDRLEAICRRLSMTLVVGTIEPSADRFRNAALIVGPTGYLTTYYKLHSPNLTEREWFIPGDTLPVVTSQGWTFGVGICYDVRFPEMFRAAALQKADFFLLAVGGSGAANLIGPDGDQTKQAEFHKMLAMRIIPARAVDNGLYVFYSNQAGHSGNGQFPGLVLAVDPSGSLIDEHLPTEGMTVTIVSRKVAADAKRSASCTCDVIRPEVYASPVTVDRAS